MSIFKFTVELSAISMNTLTLLGFINSKFILKKLYGKSFMNYYSIIMGITLVLYILSVLILSIYAIWAHNFIFALGGAFFILLPFLIGCAATYSKLNLYINLQIIVLFLSLVFIINMLGTI